VGKMRYHFAPVLFCPDTTLKLLSYAKMVKITAIKSVFTPKIHQNVLASGALPRIPLEELP